MESLWLTLWGIVRIFSKEVALFFTEIRSIQISISSQCCQKFLYVFLLEVILLCIKWHLDVVLICNSLLTMLHIFSCSYWPFVNLQFLLMMLHIFSCPYWPFVYLLWSNASKTAYFSSSCLFIAELQNFLKNKF